MRYMQLETVGWAAAAVMFLGGVFKVLGFLIEQVVQVCGKLVIAIASVRDVRQALRGENAIVPSSSVEPPGATPQKS